MNIEIEKPLELLTEFIWISAILNQNKSPEIYAKEINKIIKQIEVFVKNNQKDNTKKEAEEK